MIEIDARAARRFPALTVATPRLHIRPLEVADAPDLETILADRHTQRWLRFPDHPSVPAPGVAPRQAGPRYGRTPRAGVPRPAESSGAGQPAESSRDGRPDHSSRAGRPGGPSGSDGTGADRTGADRTGADRTGADRTGADPAGVGRPGRSNGSDRPDRSTGSNHPEPQPDGPVDRIDGLTWCTDLAERHRAGGDGDHFGVSRREDGRLIGLLWSARTDWCARSTEVSFAVSAGARGYGVGAEALDAVTIALLLEHGFQRVELRIALGNTAARRVAEKAGFVYEGLQRNAGFLHGGRVDLEMWSLVTGDLHSGTTS